MRRLHKTAIKVAAMLLMACLVLPLVGCQTPPDPTYDTRLNFLSNTGASVFRIVYPQGDCPDTVCAAAHQVQQLLSQRLGTDVAIVTDKGAAHAPDLVMPYEILIGATARVESQQTLSGLGQDEWTVRLEGHKIVVVGETNRATLAAVGHLIKDVLCIDDLSHVMTDPELKIDLEYRYRGQYEVAPVENLLRDTALERAPYSAVVLYPVPVPESASEALAVATLQGLAAANGSEQIIWRDAAYEAYYPTYLLSHPGVTLEETDDAGQPWSLASLLRRYRQVLDGYILCSADLDSESGGVAVNLAHHLNAVVVTPEHEPLAIEAGLMCLLDVSDRDDAWLRESDYFELLDRSVAVEQSTANAPALIDYAVMTGGYCYFYNGQDEYSHAQQFKFLETGARVLLGTDVGREEMISSLSDIGLQVVNVGDVLNLSTGSGCIHMTSLGQPAPENVDHKGKHTVCFILFDDRDLRSVQRDYMLNEQWYASDLRGKTAVNWTLPATLTDLIPSVLSYLELTKTGADDFLMHLTAPRYSYSAEWQMNARRFLATRAAMSMKYMGLRYLQLPAGAFDARMHEVLLEQDSIDGLVSLDPLDGTYLSGEFKRVLGKPVVSPRYYLNAENTDVSLSDILLDLNSGETDASSVRAYSLVVIDAGVGLNEQGQLAAGADPTALLAALVDGLGEKADVVTLSEFMARIDRGMP